MVVWSSAFKVQAAGSLSHRAAGGFEAHLQMWLCLRVLDRHRQSTTFCSPLAPAWGMVWNAMSSPILPSVPTSNSGRPGGASTACPLGDTTHILPVTRRRQGLMPQGDYQ